MIYFEDLTKEYAEFMETFKKKVDDECSLVAVDIAKEYDKVRKNIQKEAMERYFTKENGQIRLKEDYAEYLDKNNKNIVSDVRKYYYTNILATVSGTEEYAQSKNLVNDIYSKMMNKNKNTEKVKYIFWSISSSIDIYSIIMEKFKIVNEEYEKKRMENTEAKKYAEAFEKEVKEINNKR